MDGIFDRTVRFIQGCVRWKEQPSKELILDELRRFKILLVIEDVSVASIVKFDLVNLLSRTFSNITLLTTNEETLFLPSIAKHSTSENGDLVSWSHWIQPTGEFNWTDGLNNQSFDLVIVLGSTKLSRQIRATEMLYLNAIYWDARVSYEEPTTSDSDWTGFGGRLSVVMSGIETIKSFIRKIGVNFPEYFNDKTAFDTQSSRTNKYSALNLIGHSTADLPFLPKNISIPDSLLISGGAITSSAFYYLLTMFNVTGVMTVVEPKLIDEPDLNRYLFTTMNDVGKLKVDIFKRYESTNLKISVHPVRFQEWYHSSQSLYNIVLAGVDHIQSRLDIGKMSFMHLINGATWLDTMTISVHDNDPTKTCIGCLNTDPYQTDEVTPTYGPVSALAGLFLAVRWVLLAIQFNEPESLFKTLYVKSLQHALKGNTDWSMRMPVADCPLKRH